MKKTLSLLLTIMCFILSTVYAQIGSRDKSNYEIQTRAINNSDANFRYNEMVLDAAGIENKAKLINLRFDRNRGIRLDDTELIEDDAPATGVPEGYKMYTDRGSVAWVEDLRKGVVIKKILEVDNPSAVSARVVFKGFEVKGNTQPLYLSLNGEKFVRPASAIAFPHARQYIDIVWDRWYFIDLPVEKLRKGENELLMWTESDSTSWRVLIALDKEFKIGSLTRTSPNRSMKSSDGGKTWSDSHLGAMNSVDGEYSVRMSLDHYLSSGEYTSPLLDIVDGDIPLKRNISDLKVSMWPEIEEPAQTRARAFVRFGSSPFIENQSWTEWEPMERGKDYSLTDKRYFQWKVELSTTDPLNTPKIKGLRITATWEDHSPNGNAGVHPHVINNGEIIPLSYPFVYENLNHPLLKKYREDHKLDQIIAGASSEFQIMMRLLNWAYRVPLTKNDYSWNWNDVTINPGKSVSASEMPKLNGPFFDGRRMKEMCLYPTQALVGALLSMGFQARHININSEGMSGHEVTEVWSNEFNKWIYLDPTVDSYYFDPETGVPLNVLEMHNLLVKQMPRVENWERPFVPDIGKEVVSRIKIGVRQGNNPYSIVNYNNDKFSALETMGHFKIILRNDFLSNPFPIPVSQGTTMWGWNGFLNWYDNTFPKRDEYQRYTNRSTDFYPPLNQAKIFLNETNEPGVINVVTEELTPGGFDGFLVQVNDGAWLPQNKSNWSWKLRNGMNSLKVRTKNVRGILGPVSDISVTYNP